jgi:murein DD-endopeptidase MepM/ murein hydrolase activator NlpD
LAAVTGEDVDALDEFRATRAQRDASLAELTEREAEQTQALDALRSKRAALDAELSKLEALEAQRLAEEQRRRQEEARQAAEAEARARAEEQARVLAAQQAAAAEGKRVTGPSASTTTTPTTAPGRSGTATTSPPTTAAPPRGGSGGSQIATGAWVCPVQGARSFIDSWGFPRPGGRAHQGVDIMSPRGTPVVTPVAGAVQLRGNSVGGLSFHLSGADGNYYYGTHMDAYADIANGTYPAGTVVGYVGDTGDARGTGTHLHFEIHIGGRGGAINPYPTVAAHC